MIRTRIRAAALAATVALAALTGGTLATTADLGDVARIDATPSDPNEAESTHAVVVPLGTEAGSINRTFDDVVVDYTVGKPTADVSNVGAGTVERIGVDRDGDDPGTQIDVAASIASVSGKKDGAAVRITTKGNVTLEPHDEVVVVIRPVQNPQNAGTAQVEVTINSQGAADTATDTVDYEYNDANVTMSNQSTDSDTVVVDSVTLSEGGFVAVQNTSGEFPDEIRGSSVYLSAGTHENVEVHLDEEVTENVTLYAQVYMDTNADLRFDYEDSGGEVDGPYLTKDGNVMAVDPAEITYDSSSDRGATPTPTESPTPTPTPTDSPTPTPTDSPTPTESPTPTDTATATDTRTPTATDTPKQGRESPTPTATPTPGESPTSTATDTPTEAVTGTDTRQGGPGFGAGLAVVALLAGALLALRR